MKVMELVNGALKIGKLYRPEPWRLHLIHRRPVVHLTLKNSVAKGIVQQELSVI